ncbi:hypothetical protein BH10ACI2_BH10ACI2_00720 [soil metagenome]
MRQSISTFRILIAICLAVDAILAAGCNSVQKRVAMADVCQKDQGSIVSVEGYLRLPILNNEESRDEESQNTYTLLLVERPNGTGGFLTTSTRATVTNEPNRIRDLPVSYTYNDFSVFTDTGQVASADDRVIVTGHVYRNAKPCILKIDKIETVATQN